MSARALGALLILFVSAACAHRNVCPAKGGPPWRELTTRHFRVWTDLDAAAANTTVQHLEHYRKALLYVWGNQFDPPGRVDVVVFRSGEDLYDLIGGRWRISGFVAKSGPTPIVVMTLDYDRNVAQRVELHELAHYLNSYLLLRQPRWLSEGLASYIETAQVIEAENKVILGRSHLDWIRYISRSRESLESMWQWTGSPQDSEQLERLYASSWFWVHYLFNHQTKRFLEFLDRLGRAEDPKAAWRAAFEGVADQDLEAALAYYARGGTYRLITFPIEVAATPVSERGLDDTEVHVVRSKVILHAQGDPFQKKKRVLQEVDEVLSQDPWNVDAVIARTEFMTNEEERLALAKALVEKKPGSGSAWAYLAKALGRANGSEAERTSALEHAAKCSPEDPAILTELARDYLSRAEAQKALPLATKAAGLAPADAAIVDTYAASLAGARRCSEAAAMQRRAIDLLYDDGPDTSATRQKFTERLRGYESACNDKPVTPAQR
jgi:tetratricopeptide (TPR) repeat protein